MSPVDVFDHLGTVAPMSFEVRRVIPVDCPRTRRMRMPKVIYAIGGVSADGRIVAPDGQSDW
jgi:hypothetical protein